VDEDTHADICTEEPWPKERKTVSPLSRLLMTVRMDDLLLYLHRLGLQYVLSRTVKGQYKFIIFQEGMEKYAGTSQFSPRAACCDALGRFLVGTKGKDFHDYIRLSKNARKNN
jgi:hypothetical protein